LVTLNDDAYLDILRMLFCIQNAGSKRRETTNKKGYEIALYKPISADKLSADEVV
jgi:hypothetical protein